MSDFKHADFWVAVATVAAALLIANTLVVTQMLRSKVGWASFTAYALSAVAAFLSSLAILPAMWSLDDGRDRGLGLTTGSTAAVWVAAMMTFFAALFAGFAEDDSTDVTSPS